MKVQNAIKKLEKAGYAVKATHCAGPLASPLMIDTAWLASKPGSERVIEFHRNGRGEEITCIRSRRQDERDDTMTDYFCGRWHDTITEAIKCAP